MPNHVTNILEIKGPNPKAVLRAVKGRGDDGEQALDFNRIAPMPDELKDTASPTKVVPDRDYKKAVEDRKSESKKIGMELGMPISESMQKRFIREYGADNWYDWAYNTWGTKWNAYEVNASSDRVITFQTAWAMPEPIIKRLSQMFPHNTFVVDWADEDIGCNTGQIAYKDGVVVSSNVPDNGSVEAYEHAFEVMPEYRESFRLVDGEYKYVEE